MYSSATPQTWVNLSAAGQIAIGRQGLGWFMFGLAND